MKKKIKTYLLAALVLSCGIMTLAQFSASRPAFAAPDPSTSVDCSKLSGSTGGASFQPGSAGEAGCVYSCPVGGNKSACATDPALQLCDSSKSDANKQNCDIVHKYVNPAILVFSAIAGVTVAAAIVYGGILYSTSGGDQAKVSKAKNLIRNAVLSLVAFMFLYAFLQWIVPGGIFNSK